MYFVDKTGKIKIQEIKRWVPKIYFFIKWTSFQPIQRKDAISMCFGKDFSEKCYGLPDKSLDNLAMDLKNSSQTEFQPLPELNANHNGARPIYFKGIIITFSNIYGWYKASYRVFIMKRQAHGDRWQGNRYC